MRARRRWRREGGDRSSVCIGPVLSSPTLTFIGPDDAAIDTLRQVQPPAQPGSTSPVSCICVTWFTSPPYREAGKFGERQFRSMMLSAGARSSPRRPRACRVSQRNARPGAGRRDMADRRATHNPQWRRQAAPLTSLYRQRARRSSRRRRSRSCSSRSRTVASGWGKRGQAIAARRARRLWAEQVPGSGGDIRSPAQILDLLEHRPRNVNRLRGSRR